MAEVEGSISYHAFLREFREAFAGQLDENALAEAVDELQKLVTANVGAADIDAAGGKLHPAQGETTAIPGSLLGGTSASVSISNTILKVKTHGGKTFTGQDAKGKSSGFGYLYKASTTLYTDTKSYQLSPGKVLATIAFKNASGKTLGTWTGKLVPRAEACSGPGSWAV